MTSKKPMIHEVAINGIITISSIFRVQFIFPALFGIILLCNGCSTTDPVKKKGIVVELPNNNQKNTRRFLVIGIGIVTVSDTNKTDHVFVADQTSLGIYAGNTPGMIFGAGYQSSVVTAISDIEDTGDVLVEVTREAFGRTDVTCAVLSTNQTKGGRE